MACVSKEDSMFQRTVPLYATESFTKRVLKRGTKSDSRALVECDRSRFFAMQLLRAQGGLALLVPCMHLKMASL